MSRRMPPSHMAYASDRNVRDQPGAWLSSMCSERISSSALLMTLLPCFVDSSHMSKSMLPTLSSCTSCRCCSATMAALSALSSNLLLSLTESLTAC